MVGELEYGLELNKRLMIFAESIDDMLARLTYEFQSFSVEFKDNDGVVHVSTITVAQ